MASYRKRPVEIEAVPWTGTNWDEIIEFVRASGNDADWTNVVRDLASSFLYVNTLEGRMRCTVGDWLIRGIAGEYYPCRADVFEATYEAVDVLQVP